MLDLRRLVCVLLAAAPALSAQSASPGAPIVPASPPLAAPGDKDLLVDAAKLDLRYGGKPTTGAKVDGKLGPLVRHALNTWAGVAQQLELTVVVPQKADALVMGRAPLETLSQAARWADDASALLDKCRPAGGGAARGAVVMVLFDDAGFATDGWPRLLETMLERHMINADCVERMKASPGSLMVRQSLFFTQHTWDMVGDAAAGDDEYRLGNEIAHKTAQLLVEARFGRQPEVLRWGIGHVAEQRLFRNVYQFNATGMVAAADHFDWPGRTGDGLKTAGKLPSFSLVDTILGTSQPGTMAPGQRDAWAALDYSLAKEPEALSALFAELGALHRAADPAGNSMEYLGAADATHAACAKTWGALKITALCEHLKRVK